jgi:hypothetical protein
MGNEEEITEGNGQAISTPVIKPTVGRIVYYKLSQTNAEQINKRRNDYGQNPKTDWPAGAQAHVGNRAEVGEIYPMIIVRVWPEDTHGVNGQVLLDGNDLFWVTSVAQGEAEGDWDWMPFQKTQQLRAA